MPVVPAEAVVVPVPLVELVPVEVLGLEVVLLVPAVPVPAVPVVFPVVVLHGPTVFVVPLWLGVVVVLWLGVVVVDCDGVVPLIPALPVVTDGVVCVVEGLV